MTPPLSPRATARVIEAVDLVAALRDNLHKLGRQLGRGGGDVAAAATHLREAESRLHRALATGQDHLSE